MSKWKKVTFIGLVPSDGLSETLDEMEAQFQSEGVFLSSLVVDATKEELTKVGLKNEE